MMLFNKDSAIQSASRRFCTVFKPENLVPCQPSGRCDIPSGCPTIQSIIRSTVFEFLFDCFISYLYMRVLKLTLGKIIISAIFLLFSAFLCEASRQTWLIVRTYAVQSVASLASWSSGRDRYRFLSMSFLSLPYAHICIFIDLSCHVVYFSRRFLPRFWHSLKISSHSMVFAVFSLFF